MTPQPTPRTDAESGGPGQTTREVAERLFDLARELERENASLLALLAEFAAEDSQCRHDWLDMKKAARALIAKLEAIP